MAATSASFGKPIPPHYLAVAPKGALSDQALQKLADDSLPVIDVHTRMFGDIPYDQYWTLMVFDGAAGGHEHSNSYLAELPKYPDEGETVRVALGTHSHEYFHAFNVKRIRPAEMFPYRYDEPNFTPLLWFSEGVTNYYGQLGLLRAGLILGEMFLERQAATIGSIRTTTSAKYVSIEESSVNAWLPNMFEGEPKFSPNYYPSGQIIGLLLDLSIRHDTHNTKSLDDVMRSLYWDFYKKGKGFATGDLIGVINQITRSDYSSFFREDTLAGPNRLRTMKSWPTPD
jgi:predicted metalloprotease with PDZ domain